jgi:hypothetical protein
MSSERHDLQSIVSLSVVKGMQVEMKKSEEVSNIMKK